MNKPHMFLFVSLSRQNIFAWNLGFVRKKWAVQVLWCFLFNIFPSFFYAYVFNLNNHIKQLWAFFLPILYGMSIYAVYNILDSFSFSISYLKTCRNLFPLQTIVHWPSARLWFWLAVMHYFNTRPVSRNKHYSCCVRITVFCCNICLYESAVVVGNMFCSHI